MHFFKIVFCLCVCFILDSELTQIDPVPDVQQIPIKLNSFNESEMNHFLVDALRNVKIDFFKRAPRQTASMANDGSKRILIRNKNGNVIQVINPGWKHWK